MTKLCERGKKAAKAKFKVYPSAYANAYASKICAGKIKDPSGVKRKDFKGPKPKTAKDGNLITDDSPLKKQKQFEKAKVKGVNDSFGKEYNKLKKVYDKKTKTNVLQTKKNILKNPSRYTPPNISPEDFNVGGHAVMGSPVSVDVDGDTLSNPSASAYYKDLLK